MSTFSLGNTALMSIYKPALWLAYNGHKNSSFMSTRYLLNRGLSHSFLWGNQYCTKGEIIHRLIDTLSIFNQRATSKRYAHNGEFFKLERFNDNNFLIKDYEPNKADFAQALKNLNCLMYNLDDYEENETIKGAYTGLRELFLYHIINESPEYKAAKWGS